MARSSSYRKQVVAKFTTISLLLLLLIFFPGCSAGGGNHPNSTTNSNTRSVPGFTTYRLPYTNQSQIKDCPVQILFQTDRGLVDISPGMVPENATSINTDIYYNPVWQKILPGLTDGDPNLAAATREMVQLPSTGLMYQEIRTLINNQAQVKAYALVDDFSYKPYTYQTPDNEGYYYGLLRSSHQIPAENLSWPGTTYLEYKWTPPSGDPYSYCSFIETKIEVVGDQKYYYYRLGTRTDGVDNFLTDWIPVPDPLVSFGVYSGYTPVLKGEYKFEYSVNDSKVYEKTWINRELVMSNAPQPIEFTIGDIVNFGNNSMSWDQGTGTLVPTDSATSYWEVVIYDDNNAEVWRSNLQNSKDLNIEWDSGTLTSTPATTSRTLTTTGSKLTLMPLTSSTTIESVKKALSRSDDDTTGEEPVVLYYKLNARSLSYPQSSIYDNLILDDIWYRITTEKTPITGTVRDPELRIYRLEDDGTETLLLSSNDVIPPWSEFLAYIPDPIFLILPTLTNTTALRSLITNYPTRKYEVYDDEKLRIRVHYGPKGGQKMKVKISKTIYPDMEPKEFIFTEDPAGSGNYYADITISDDLSSDIYIPLDGNTYSYFETFQDLSTTSPQGNGKDDTCYVQFEDLMKKFSATRLGSVNWTKKELNEDKDKLHLPPSFSSFEAAGFERLKISYPYFKTEYINVKVPPRVFMISVHGNYGDQRLLLLFGDDNYRTPAGLKNKWRITDNMHVVFFATCSSLNIGNFNKIKKYLSNEVQAGIAWMGAFNPDSPVVLLGYNYVATHVHHRKIFMRLRKYFPGINASSENHSKAWITANVGSGDFIYDEGEKEWKKPSNYIMRCGEIYDDFACS